MGFGLGRLEGPPEMPLSRRSRMRMKDVRFSSEVRGRSSSSVLVGSFK